MIEAGGGHKMPALAVFESLKRLYPGKYEMTVLDFVKDWAAWTWTRCTEHLEVPAYPPQPDQGYQTFDFITGR
jgi:hypothetical protein